MEIPLSYGLKHSDPLVIEPGTADISIAEVMYALVERPYDEEELERVMRHAVILFHREAGTFAACLETAIIWERG